VPTDELRSAFERAGGTAFVEELVQAAEDVREGAARVRDILRDTRALAHNHDLAPVPFDINEAIRSSLRVVAAEIRHKAEVVTRLETGLFVNGNAGRMSQVFVNLLVNAAEAFGNAPNNAIAITSKNVGNHVVVTVHDNGPGISPEHLPRIFDTFFTTKTTTSATGLGLPISRDIVRSYGGEISVESSRGAGTLFSIVLPQSPVIRSVPSPSTPPPIASTAGNQLRLLFVDDEPNLLRSYSRAFAKTHAVTLAKDGEEALAFIRQRTDWDLIVCDLSMPGMSGMQLYHVIREQFPGLIDRIVFATGGVTQRDIEEFLASITNRVLEKPFDMSVLREMLAELQRQS
jgi:CheY-like chemotaxis protein/two-component sensor histidine kinase